MRTDINSVPPNSLYSISAGLAFKAAHSTLSYIEENASSLADFNPGIVAPQRSKARLLQEVNVHSRLAQVIWRDAHKAKGAGERLLRRRPPSHLVPRHFGPPSLIRMEDAAYALRGCRTRDHLGDHQRMAMDISLRIHTPLERFRTKLESLAQEAKSLSTRYSLAMIKHTRGACTPYSIHEDGHAREPDGVILPPSNLPPSPYQPLSVICRPVRSCSQIFARQEGPSTSSGFRPIGLFQSQVSLPAAAFAGYSLIHFYLPACFANMPCLQLARSFRGSGRGVSFKLRVGAKNSDGLHPYPAVGNQRQSWEESLDCQKVPSQRPYMSPITAAAGATINDSMLRTWSLEALVQQPHGNKPKRRGSSKLATPKKNPGQRDFRIPSTADSGRTARAERFTLSVVKFQAQRPLRLLLYCFPNPVCCLSNVSSFLRRGG
ncbi:uncharacterized protein CLUP02_09082 [Colletotrichum lupini]|uniref:Uncharacterized protein n=1 Tax=Colletotrichum lupini TaxID=145971 RepID=A0A9Q8WH89_9PEZI|nr:uncharacterized protein CLUP02_09082 [Colletotrichum lupini]UQC83588.1 hypothetical protein CLUP02_09082 [Colletotrichum lupini]